MHSLKLTLLAILGLTTLAACSTTFGAAPTPSSQHYQDFVNSQRLNPDIASRRGS